MGYFKILCQFIKKYTLLRRQFGILKMRDRGIDMNISWILVFLPILAQGVCPLCTLAVGAGVGFSRWLAIDDLISGLWIGALLLSLSLWLIKWLRAQHIPFAFDVWIIPSVIALVYMIALIPLYCTGILGHPSNQWHGIDRLLSGIMLGSVIFMMSLLIHAAIKMHYGRVVIRFQKVIIPAAILTLASVIVYIAIRR